MVNPQQLKKVHNYSIPKGNKLTIYATESAIEAIVSSEGENFITESSLVHASRPKDKPLAVANYGKLMSSPMGNIVTATVKLPRDMANKSEFLLQMANLCDMATESKNLNNVI